MERYVFFDEANTPRAVPYAVFSQGEKRDFNCHCQIDIPILRHCQIDIPILAESVLRQTNACFQVCAIQKKVTHRDRHHTLLNQIRRSYILRRCSFFAAGACFNFHASIHDMFSLSSAASMSLSKPAASNHASRHDMFSSTSSAEFNSRVLTTGGMSRLAHVVSSFDLFVFGGVSTSSTKSISNILFVRVDSATTSSIS